MLEKIELMLKVYREKLEKINNPPIDYVEGLRVSAQISVLENLYYYAQQESAQHSVKPTPFQGWQKVATLSDDDLEALSKI